MKPDEQDLHSLDSHFRFGENWSEFEKKVGEERIAFAIESLDRLIEKTSLSGSKVIDIGCGSGLSMLAALHLGAKDVVGLDLDPKSVGAAKVLLGRFAQGKNWSVEEKSIFDIDSKSSSKKYDVVHSWGVLHHTGDMWRALGVAAELVAPGGVFCFAIYRKTLMCSFWRLEKKFYSNSSPWIQKIIRGLFKLIVIFGLTITMRNPSKYLRDYKKSRGMDLHHDVHDWLGGYPYESASPPELQAFLESRGFNVTRAFTKKAFCFGLLGSHCDEYVARKNTHLCVE